MSQALTKENFNQEVINSQVPVLVDFWAPWCGPCRILSPILDRLETKHQGKAKIFKVNVDEQPELAGHFGIRGIPTVIIFDQKKVKQQLVGVQPEAVYDQALKG